MREGDEERRLVCDPSDDGESDSQGRVEGDGGDDYGSDREFVRLFDARYGFSDNIRLRMGKREVGGSVRLLEPRAEL